MIDINVPVRSSPWAFGTGTVMVPPFSTFCITTWLPLRLASVNPCSESIRGACRPANTRSLANRYVHVRHVHLIAERALDFVGRSRLVKQVATVRSSWPAPRTRLRPDWSMSSSGRWAKKPSPSRSIIVVNCLIIMTSVTPHQEAS